MVHGRRRAERVAAAVVQADPAPEAEAPAGRLVCGDCNRDVAQSSRAWHAKSKHGKRAGEIQWSPADVVSAAL
jgi:hypothetical protein